MTKSERKATGELIGIYEGIVSDPSPIVWVRGLSFWRNLPLTFDSIWGALKGRWLRMRLRRDILFMRRLLADGYETKSDE